MSVTDGISFDYVYHYTDHLGNVRLSYSKPNGGTLWILEENHYHPFGLKHINYGAERNDYERDESGGTYAVLRPVVRNKYQYKFQGQERQDELGLNWDSFKWRNYDYAIGRFMSIDKLAEDYSYQSPYNFAENRVVDGRELEGLEWRASTSSDGKTVSLNLTVRTVNSSKGIITNEQMSTMANERANALNATIGGKDLLGRNVNVSVI